MKINEDKTSNSLNSLWWYHTSFSKSKIKKINENENEKEKYNKPSPSSLIIYRYCLSS